MSKLLTIVGAQIAGFAAGAIMMTSAMAATTLKIQLAVPLSADEAVMVIQLIGLALIFIFPQLVLWLPAMIYGD